jgi:hypothetical protein
MALDANEVLTWSYGEFGLMSITQKPIEYSKDLFSLNGLTFSRPPSENRKKPEQATLAGRSLRGNYISNTDRNKGRVSEELFAEKLEATGLSVFTLPHFESNYKKHIDFEVQDATGRCLWIDVKSPKSLRKTNMKDDDYGKPQDRYVCLQLSDNGDLFGSHSDYIAFGLTDGRFIISDRLKLIECVSKHLLASPILGRSAWPETALWVPYVRSYKNVHLVMTYMDLEDLKDSIVAILK